MRGILCTVGVGVALVSAMFCVVFATELVTGSGGKTEPPVLAGLVVFFLGTGLAGAYLAWRMMRPPGADPLPGFVQGWGRRPEAASQDTDAERERRILAFAEAEHGRVTIPEVAAHCRMTVAQAKSDLDRMVVQRVAELLVTEKGVLVYVFRGFISDDEKSTAHDF
jgi:hypothetical protein